MSEDENRLIFYCKACRETGLAHCAYPEECGQMDTKISYHEAKKHNDNIDRWWLK